MVVILYIHLCIASTNAAKITSATSMVSTTSSTASISQTVTSALTATPVHHIPSSLGIDIHIQYKAIRACILASYINSLRLQIYITVMNPSQHMIVLLE